MARLLWHLVLVAVMALLVPSSLHVSLQVARAFRCVGLHLFSSIFRTGSYSQSANGRMVGSPLLGTRSTMHLSDSRPAPAFSCPPGPGETLIYPRRITLSYTAFPNFMSSIQFLEINSIIISDEPDSPKSEIGN